MKIITSFLCCLCMQFSLAQSPKRQDDILFKKTIVRAMDMREKSNREIFGTKNKMASILMEAYCSGRLKGYENALLNKALSYEVYEARMQHMQQDVKASLAGNLHVMEIEEFLIVDKHRSDFYFNMESMTLFIPADLHRLGIQEALISFSYADCAALFKSNKEAVSMNPLKNGRNINYADVFLLRMFKSTIVKIGGEETDYFDQQHPDALSAFTAAKLEENALTEYLYKLYHPE